MVSMTNEEIDFAVENGPFTKDGWVEYATGMYTPGRPAINSLIEYSNSLKGIAQKQEISEIMNFREDILKYVDVNGFMYETDIAEGYWDDKLKICRDSFSRLIELLQKGKEFNILDKNIKSLQISRNRNDYFIVFHKNNHSIYTKKAYQEWFLPALESFNRLISH
jgi:hypothetical protein